jgi:hypothetical protein
VQRYAAYVELAEAYERLATLETKAGDGSSRPIVAGETDVGVLSRTAEP